MASLQLLLIRATTGETPVAANRKGVRVHECSDHAGSQEFKHHLHRCIITADAFVPKPHADKMEDPVLWNLHVSLRSWDFGTSSYFETAQSLPCPGAANSQSKSYLYTVGPKVSIICILEDLGLSKP